MCGGEIEINESMTIGTCLYCGSTMTLPKIDSEKKARLFNRANQYRLNCEFDKAYDAYKIIAQEDEQEAEAYWGMILSEYGVEYVEEPGSKKRIPTCHRTLIQSIRSSMNYKLAQQYADAENKLMYQEEAEELDRLQKKIIMVSSKEEPYDVFICYKESDENGERTKDSVLAQEIYHELEKQGIRTFFARISLEDKLGQNYEPYIFSALSTAKVMLMVTMNGEHCESIWVKNEWMRYLRFMGEDTDKTLIPVYKDISPYELPDEFVKLQAQDMGKIGAIQDLVYGVKKLLGKVSRGETGGIKAEERELLKRLQEENEKQKKTSEIKAKVFAGISLAFVMFWLVCMLRYTFFNVIGLHFSIEDMEAASPTVALVWEILCVLSGGIQIVAYVHSLRKGIRNKISGRLYGVGLILLCGSFILCRAVGFQIYVSSTAYVILNLVFGSVMILVSGESNKEKIGMIVSVLILVAIIHLPLSQEKIASMGNERDSRVPQIEVILDKTYYWRRLENSKRTVGYALKGQVYTIISTKSYTNGDMEYEVENSLGWRGYIKSEHDNKSVKLLEVTEE